MGPKKMSAKGSDEKRKRMMSMEMKQEIIEKHERGVRVIELARHYGRSTSTICTLLKQKDAIKSATPAKGTTIMSKLRSSVNEKMEHLLLVWVKEKQLAGHTVTEGTICEKARCIYGDLKAQEPSASSSSSPLEDSFKASRGWFANFKARSGILPRHPPALAAFEWIQDSKDGSSVPKEVDLSYKEHAPHHLLHNNHPSLVLQSLADDECFMDVTLTAAGTAIKAHKSVLSAMSPYFRDVLKANPSPHPIIVMPRDVTFQELKNIIGYIYKGEITIDGSELKSFLKTADTLQIVGLMSSETDPNLDKEAALPNCGASKEKGQKRKRGRDLSDVPLREGVDRDDPLDWETDMTLVKEELSDVSELENIWLPETEDFSSATTSFPSLEKKHESEAKRRRASSSLPLLAPDDSLKGSLEESPHQTRRAAEESPHQTRRVAEESPHQTRRAVRAKGKKTSSARTSDAAESLPTSSEVNPPPSLDDKESVFTEIGTCDALPPATKTKQTLDS